MHSDPSAVQQLYPEFSLIDLGNDWLRKALSVFPRHLFRLRQERRDIGVSPMFGVEHHGAADDVIDARNRLTGTAMRNEHRPPLLPIVKRLERAARRVIEHYSPGFHSTLIFTGPPSSPVTCVGRTLPRSVMNGPGLSRACSVR